MTLVSRIVSIVQAVGGDIKSLTDKIGDLSTLVTTEKTNLVGAINEVVASVGGGGAPTSSDVLVATDYGVVVDARRLTDIVKASNNRTIDCPSGNFTSADIGKRIRMYNATTNVYLGQSTIESVTNSTRIIITDTLVGSVTALQKSVCWIGTDNTYALQTLMNTAQTLAKAQSLNAEKDLPNRLGMVTVSIPVTEDGTGLIISDSLYIPPGVILDSGAMIVSACGTGVAADRVWAVVAQSGCGIKNLRLDAMWGMGVKFGGLYEIANSSIDKVHIWNVGNNYNVDNWPMEHIGVQVEGYGWNINEIWMNGGNLAVNIDSASNVDFNNLTVVRSTNAIKINSSENIRTKNILLDSTGGVGVAIDYSFNIQLDIQATLNSDLYTTTSMTYGVLLGEYNANKSKLVQINYSAQSTGGVACKISNVADSTIVCNLSNERQFVNGSVHKPITKGFEYGIDNAGYLVCVLNASPDGNTYGDGAPSIIIPYTGTRYGSLVVNGPVEDAPSDSQRYVRYNRTWVTDPTSNVGRHVFPVNAGSMAPSVTGGCTPLTNIATTANRPDIQTLNFNQTTQQYAQFSIAIPKRWDKGALKVKFRWSHAATSTNFGVVWGIQAVAVNNNELINVDYGNPSEVLDTGGTTNNLYISDESPEFYVGGTIMDDSLIFFRVYRKAADASDTLAIVSRLHGIDLIMNTDSENDA